MPQQAQPPAQSPPIERYENGEGGSGPQGLSQIANEVKDPPHWTRYIEVACAVLLVIITGAYTYYASQQTYAAITAATAAKSAADTAAESLKLTRKIVSSSEAAILQPNISIRELGKGPFIQIDIINSGHIAATGVSGEIDVTNNRPIRLTGVVVSAHSPSPEYQSGFISRTVWLHAPLNLQELGKQHIKATVELHYWNGLEQVDSKFCYGLIVSPYTSNQEWQDCENQEAFQQRLR